MTDTSFEGSLKKLERIAEELESDSLTLKERIGKFEEGMKLAKSCQKSLDEARGRIDQVWKENGKIKSKSFQPK